MKNQEIITSRQNRSVVELVKLNDRKTREEERKFRFDGIKLFGEALRNGVFPETVFLAESAAERVMKTVEETAGGDAFEKIGRVLTLSDDVFAKISEEKSPEGVICIAKYIDKLQKNVTIYNNAEILSLRGKSVALLESVRDPSNIGAVIRSAAAIGVDRLILSSDCADIYHPKAVRASMGTLFNQRIDRVDDLPEIIRQLRGDGRRVFAAALDGTAKRLGSFPVRQGDCVVIGNEGHGLSDAAIEAAGDLVFIPMSGRAESFNAAVAASILMWEFFKGTQN